ncbi:hypothetical protein D3C72_1182020 [compost metagenome]
MDTRSMPHLITHLAPWLTAVAIAVGGAMTMNPALAANAAATQATPLARTLQALRAGQGVPTSFEATYTMDEQARGKSQRTVFAMRFRHAPRVSRLEVRDSDHLPVGMRLRNENGGSVRIRLPGPAGFMAMAVPSRSPFSKTLMGLYPDQLTPDAFVAALLHPANQVKQVGRETIDGQSLLVVEVTGPQAIVPGATLRIALSETRPFPVRMTLQRGEDRLVQTFGALNERPLTEAELAI